MKFTISREDLLKPLQLVAGAVERRHTLPILSNILMRVDENSLWLTGTDLEVELISSAKLTGDCQNGEVTVPAKKFLDICRSLKEHTQIVFQVDGSKAHIKCGRSKYVLSTLPAEGYPNLEDWDGEVEFELAQKDLKKLIENTHFAMAQQDVRYYLNGMSFETDQNIIRTVATDGHRLALAKIDYGTVLTSKQVIIPRKGVLEILRLITDDNTLLKIKFGSNHLRIHSSEFIFTSKLVDGRFPDYRRVLPKDGDKLILVERNEFKLTLSRAAILSNEKFRGIRMNVSAGEVTVTANNPEQEEAV